MNLRLDFYEVIWHFNSGIIILNSKKGDFYNFSYTGTPVAIFCVYFFFFPQFAIYTIFDCSSCFLFFVCFILFLFFLWDHTAEILIYEGVRFFFVCECIGKISNVLSLLTPEWTVIVLMWPINVRATTISKLNKSLLIDDVASVQVCFLLGSL